MKYDLDKIMTVAVREAKKSSMKHRVSCVLVNDDGDIISKGHNHHSEGSKRLGRRTVHAEVDALKGIRKPSSNLVAFLYRHNNNVIHSCKCCEELLRAYGITKIISMHVYKLEE
jgi:tRNA(Arg) A34 adenosine deaminase TadA